MERILITGANRGIGLEFVRQYVQAGDVRVFAGCRDYSRADALRALAEQHPGKVRLLPLDISDAESIAAAVGVLEDEAAGLDLLINNAGIFPRGGHQSRSLGQLAGADVSEVITTNAVAPLILTQACCPLLQKGVRPRVVMISSQMGSLSRAGGDAYAYRMSKAAMNMGARVLSLDGAMAGIITITTHPGWVQTDMGGASAAVTPAQSVRGLKALIDGLSSADNGRFFAWEGGELPW